MRKVRFLAIDLFAGPGGLGEGFDRAGFDVLVSVDNDPRACETLRTRWLFRLLRKKGEVEQYWKYVRGEITKEEIYGNHPEIREEIGERVIEETILERTREYLAGEIGKRIPNRDTSVVVLLGGPPCQLYSFIGRARYATMKEKYYRDPRRRLFEHYIFFLEKLKPDIFVFENVPGIISAEWKRKNMFEILAEEFDRAEYIPAKPPRGGLPQDYILNAADFGVPQMRKRVIITGYKNGFERKFPNIQNVYHGICMKKNNQYFAVKDAIGDIPELEPGEGNDRWFGFYDNTDSISEYAIALRSESEGILNHRARTHMESDRERYRFFIEHYLNGNGGAGLKLLIEKRPDLVPAHKNLHGFLDRFKVQWWDQPASTITAHLAKDGHYYIHPDINQCRSFTVREAARCQSFPDNYFFEGPRTEQFRQVGNAVPPLLAECIAKSIIDAINTVAGRKYETNAITAKYSGLDKKQIRILRDKLLKWFKSNQRTYPWRETTDPLKVLIAEMMLRRTKADQVRAVYERLLTEYPDITAMVDADGRRLRNILFSLGLKWRIPAFVQVVRETSEKYGGKVPETREELKKLPGVGDYVAGAVLSIAYGKKEWIVDSNIVRLFRRYFGIKTSKEGRRDRHVIEIARMYASCKTPREANLAILDFSALVCKPFRPLCHTCPLREKCKFYLNITPTKRKHHCKNI
jgi:DNA (cytosine-5)-methyltransferase 1